MWAFRPLAGFIAASNVANGREAHLTSTEPHTKGISGLPKSVHNAASNFPEWSRGPLIDFGQS
jgi:hypothetical protein